MKRAPLFAGAGMLALLVLLTALVFALNRRDEAPLDPAQAPLAAVAAAEVVARGAYLARAGNCIGCHTARGGPAFAGGRAIDTPFGTLYTNNLTPDTETGLGAWSVDHFWRALHNGRSRDGRLLYPAFPYPNYTAVRREEADAIYAYLRSLPPVRLVTPAPALRWPYDTQAALAVWRALFFQPGVYRPQPDRPPDWNRGAYLVRGLGHCDACHAGRNLAGAIRGGTQSELGGGLIPMQNWYAPSLTQSADRSEDEIVQLLKTGVSPRAAVMGPMAEVVALSTQYLDEADLRAMAVYLRSLPPRGPGAVLRDWGRADKGEVDAAELRLGAKVYVDRCAGCHGEQGQGGAGAAYPALAGNRAVTLDEPANLLHAIISGGFPPSTAGNPRPYGMPPFGPVLSDAEIAAVATYLRQSWGHRAAPVSPVQVLKLR